jgi:hypothetical protein
MTEFYQGYGISVLRSSDSWIYRSEAGKMLQKLVMILVLLAVLTITNTASSQEQADQPVYSDGDCWVFSVIEKDFPLSSLSSLAPGGQYNVVYKKGKIKIVQMIGEGAEKPKTLLGRMLGISVSKEGQKGERESLKFPLSVGKKWTTQFYESYAGNPNLKWRTAENQVTGIETVTVPAGTFRVFKIERTVHPGMDFVYYYSMDTKSIVEYHLTTPRGKK